MTEVAKAADFLIEAAVFFARPPAEQTLPRHIKAAVQCLHTALSFVLPPTREAEIRLLLGEMLIDHTEELAMAIDHLQKAQRLTQRVPSDAAFRFRIESHLADAFLRTGALHSVASVAIEGMRRAEECAEWEWWIHFFVFDLKAEGPSAMAKLAGVKSNLGQEQVDFLDMIVALLGTCSIEHEPATDALLAQEAALKGSAYPLLGLVQCLVDRLHGPIPDGFKGASVAAMQLIEAPWEPVLSLPGFHSVATDTLQQIAKTLLTLLRIRFQLPEINVGHIMAATGRTIHDTFNSIVDVELALLAGQQLAAAQQTISSSVIAALLSTASPRPSTELVYRLQDCAPSRMQDLRLWEVQMLVVQDVEELMRAFKSDSAFAPCAFSHLLDAIMGYRLGESLHHVKEYLLEALKILNTSQGRNDLLKLCVLVLLASIYQNTDFVLAEKMAATAFGFSNNLGNDELALLSGSMLVRLFEVRGDGKRAQQQAHLNRQIESRTSSG